MTLKRIIIFISLGIAIVLALVGGVNVIFFRDWGDGAVMPDIEMQVEEIAGNEQEFSVARMFTLVPGQVIQADELDLRLVVNNIMYIPCMSNVSNCQFTSFRADLTLSLISDPTKADTVSFVGFPSEIRSLGKSLQIVSATAQNIQIIIRGSAAKATVPSGN